MLFFSPYLYLLLPLCLYCFVWALLSEASPQWPSWKEGFKRSRNPYYSRSFRVYHRLSSRVYKSFPSFVYFSVSTCWKFWDSQVCQLPCFFPQLLLNYCWYHAGPCNFYQFIHWRIPCQLDFCMIFVCFGFGISLLCLGWGGLRRFKSSAVTATEFQDIYTFVCYWYSKKKLDTHVYMVCFSWNKRNMI